MTPKQEAHAIYNRYKAILGRFNQDDGFTHGKIIECATYSVLLIISAYPHGNPFNSDGKPTIGYWIEVNKEISKLR